MLLIMVLILTGGQVGISDSYRRIIYNYNLVLNNEVDDELKSRVCKSDIRTGNRHLDRFDYVFIREGFLNNIDPLLLKSVAIVESGMHTHAVSCAGALGLMQLMPQTAKILEVKDSFDPEENIHGAARHLSYLLRKHKGETSLALAEYYCGVIHKEVPKVARPYTGRVMQVYNNLKGG